MGGWIRWDNQWRKKATQKRSMLARRKWTSGALLQNVTDPHARASNPPHTHTQIYLDPAPERRFWCFLPRSRMIGLGPRWVPHRCRWFWSLWRHRGGLGLGEVEVEVEGEGERGECGVREVGKWMESEAGIEELEEWQRPNFRTSPTLMARERGGKKQGIQARHPVQPTHTTTLA